MDRITTPTELSAQCYFMIQQIVALVFIASKRPFDIFSCCLGFYSNWKELHELEMLEIPRKEMTIYRRSADR
jgi:hypothetical protein